MHVGSPLRQIKITAVEYSVQTEEDVIAPTDPVSHKSRLSQERSLKDHQGAIFLDLVLPCADHDQGTRYKTRLISPENLTWGGWTIFGGRHPGGGFFVACPWCFSECTRTISRPRGFLCACTEGVPWSRTNEDVLVIGNTHTTATQSRFQTPSSNLHVNILLSTTLKPGDQPPTEFSFPKGHRHNIIGDSSVPLHTTRSKRGLDFWIQDIHPIILLPPDRNENTMDLHVPELVGKAPRKKPGFERPGFFCVSFARNRRSTHHRHYHPR
jgi:hypothetical protein